MKVTFKLNAAQKAAALKICMESWVAADPEGEYEHPAHLFPHGEKVKENYNYNNDQRLVVVGDKLVYEGQRHPLRQDGAFYDILEIFGWKRSCVYDECWKKCAGGVFSTDYVGYEEHLTGFARTIEVSSYETSDNRMAWFETMADLVKRDEEAALDYFLSEKVGQWWSAQDAAIALVPRLAAIADVMRKGSALAYAQYANADVRKAMVVLNVLKKRGEEWK